MLSVSCCVVDCLQQDVNNRVIPHTCVWDCDENKNRSGDDPFYANFERLPHEMKIHCLSFCKFHALANTEIWLQDEDRVHFEKTVLQDRHLTRSAGFTKLYDFNKTHSNVRVCTPDHVLSCIPHTEIGHLQKPFGSVNFYPSFYFRRCTHFDSPTEEETDKCIRRYHATYVRPPRLHDDAVNLDLSPGLYYWELVNYRWENELADSSGDCSRQKHFHIDPSDSSHDAPSPGEDSAFPMSLMYRRVVHPSAEVHDRFVTVATFENTTAERVTSIYFSFNDSDAGECKPVPLYGVLSQFDATMYMGPPSDDESDETHLPRQLACHQMVYRHVPCPTYGLKLYKHHVGADNKQSNEVGYYFIKLPVESRLVSLDRNSNTFRLNFIVNRAKAPRPIPETNYGYAFT